MVKSPESVEALLADIGAAGEGEPLLARHLHELRLLLARPAEAESQARRIVEAIAVATQASLMLRQSSPASASAFIASRLGERSRTFGTLGPQVDCAALIASAGDW
jgi:putative acyl-CoA dehydrogenase